MTRVSSLNSYMRLTKPRIILLLLLVAASSYVASSPGTVSVSILLVLMLSGALSSAGSSAVNHYLDRDLDAVMERTKRRPLPTGAIKPPERALAFGLALLAAGILSSLLLINSLTAAFVALGAFIYLVVYTLGLKRRNPSNIVIGGFAGSCPALAGSAAAVNAITLPALLIALLVFLWTPGHFWALGLRNKADYQRARVPMLPAIVGDGYAATAIIGSTLVLPLYVPLFFFLGVVSVAALLPALIAGVVLLYLSLSIRRDPKSAWSSFKFSGIFLMVTLLTVALSSLVP